MSLIQTTGCCVAAAVCLGVLITRSFEAIENTAVLPLFVSYIYFLVMMLCVGP